MWGVMQNAFSFGSASCYVRPEAVASCIYCVVKMETAFQAESGFCLETVIKNLHETYQCRMYSREILMMGREDARNM